jgi:nucleoside-diphosphate-sugar epimerase
MINSSCEVLGSASSCKRAFVTGGSGFSGGYLVRHLAQDGWEVHALSRQGQVQIEDPPATTWYLYDGSYQSISAAIQQARPEVVFHLAAYVQTEHQPEDIDALNDANLRVGMYLLEAMSKCGVTKLINTGTYWQHLDNEEYNPVNLYAATKHAFEAIVDYYCRAHALRAITLKLFDTYGPRDQRKKLIPLILKAIELGEAIDMTEGFQKISLVHVLDVCQAYTQAASLLSGSGGHDRFGLFGDNSMSIREVVAILERKFQRALVVNWGALVSPPRQMQTLPTLRRLPNWSPTRHIADC